VCAGYHSVPQRVTHGVICDEWDPKGISRRAEIVVGKSAARAFPDPCLPKSHRAPPSLVLFSRNARCRGSLKVTSAAEQSPSEPLRLQKRLHSAYPLVRALSPADPCCQPELRNLSDRTGRTQRRDAPRCAQVLRHTIH
jgi:hypothetical protein